MATVVSWQRLKTVVKIEMSELAESRPCGISDSFPEYLKPRAISQCRLTCIEKVSFRSSVLFAKVLFYVLNIKYIPESTGF